MIHRKYYIVIICILFLKSVTILGFDRRGLNRESLNKIQVTSINCIEHDREFARFAYCKLKPINRTLKLLSLRVLLLKPPVNKSNIHFSMLKKANGYKPFIIDVKLDICKYFAGKKNPIFDWFYALWLPYTNINHTCPYFSDMIVEKMPLSNIKFPSVFPEGDYRLDFHVDAYDILRATAQIYVSISEQQIY